ncbi:MAG: alkaline phosphatase family protein [Bowdeniella nasicola]|nr:alkaline phosphatase family protein [Bowdeniella nasicola]
MIPHLRQVLGGLCDAVGYSSTDPQDHWQRDRHALELPRVERAVLVLIDGMGAHQLAAHRGHLPYLRHHLDKYARTSLPSTTACAITTLGTGREPGRTGMVGYTARDPHSGERVQLISFPGAPLSPEAWQREPTIAERCEHEGTFCSVGPRKFSGSGLTRAAWRGVREVFAETLSERVEHTLREVRSGARLVYLYWAELDHVGHIHGPGSPHWTAELEAVDAALGELERRLPRSSALVVTSDHGMIPLTARLDVAHAPAADTFETAGEERFLHVYAQDAHALRAPLTDWLGQAGAVLTRDQAEAHLGAFAPHVRERVGDLVILARGTYGISDSRWMSPMQRALRGGHGSDSAAECEVPLVVRAL